MSLYPWLQPTWRQLLESIRGNRVAHALLISGIDGSGAETLARHVAQYLLCSHPAADSPCGSCPACRQFMADSHPDFREVTFEEDDKGKLRKQIVIDQVRELNGALGTHARQGGWKVVILHPAEAMNVNAANSLLKTLEEPSDRTLIMLVSARPAALLPTIRSRCQHVRIGKIDRAASLRWLQEKSVADAEIVLAQAEYAPLRARQLAESTVIGQRAAMVSQLLALKTSKTSVIKVAETMQESGETEVIRWLSSALEDIVHLHQGAGTAHDWRNPDLLDSLKTLADSLNLVAVHRYRDVLRHAERMLRAGSVNAPLLLQSVLLPWSRNFDNRTIDKLLEGM